VGPLTPGAAEALWDIHAACRSLEKTLLSGFGSQGEDDVFEAAMRAARDIDLMAIRAMQQM
jgi:hypothetical protein